MISLEFKSPLSHQTMPRLVCGFGNDISFSSAGHVFQVFIWLLNSKLRTRAGICSQTLNLKAKPDNSGFKFVSEAKVVNGKWKQIISHIVQLLAPVSRDKCLRCNSRRKRVLWFGIEIFSGKWLSLSFIVWTKVLQDFDKEDKWVWNFQVFPFCKPVHFLPRHR